MQNKADSDAIICTFPAHMAHWRHACAGLSVAQVESVQGNTVTFRGADVVDGTPVLDIKPYIPFVDGVTNASAPHWVRYVFLACMHACKLQSTAYNTQAHQAVDAKQEQVHHTSVSTLCLLHAQWC